MRKGVARVANAQIIACVDDDASVREALAGLLRSVGLTGEMFASAEDLLRFARLGQVSCLIADMKLTGMSGLQLQKHLGARGIAIPTIIISGFDDEPMRRQLLAEGALGFLRKPIHDAELLAFMRTALEQSLAPDTRSG
jgi:FixJ family two-component response regulator